MAYIKSHSNYVIKEKHQLTNDGTIFERDMATVGGLNKFALGQQPIYQSGNFVITVNTDESSTKDYTSGKWEKKNDNDEVWTLEDIENISKTEKQNTNEIILKKDFYRLRDFAYYGSCSELVRASITDIIKRFPGELYTPIIDDNGINVYFTNLGKTEILGNEKLFLVDNPFNIQLHVSNINIHSVEDELKYLCNGLSENYEIFTDENSSKTPIYSICWDNYVCYDGEHISIAEALNKEDYNPKKVGSLGVGQMVSQITINDNISIYAFNGNYGNIIYLTESYNLGLHIRPKEEFYNKFFSTLDSFQNVLLNRKTSPIYTASFEVIKENSFGYETRIKKFTFPRTYGDYNLATSDAIFSSYLDELVNVSLFYDERFCDNLFRNMTHESIKNFDWSYTKELDEDDVEENIIGGSKIQKFIRLMGREFDEIKFYIDNIANSNNITYDDKNNLPDYFLTDVLNNDGWEIKNIHPINCPNHTHSETFKPYTFTERINNYFCLRKCDGSYTYEETKTNSREKVDDSGVLRHRISHYNSDKEYTINEINSHFMKMLKLNSRNIIRHKSTIEGIEMILGLFGLKSKSYFDLLNKNKRFDGYLTDYDYTITEYTTFAKPIKDIDGGIDKFNRKKTINYGTSYKEYQGLMVRPSITNDTTYLYPYFSPYKNYDGNPYYQMNGGWMKIDDNFTETIRNIKYVDTIEDLTKTHYGSLSNGEIYFVKYLNDDKFLIDGIIYDINSEYLNGSNYRYISVYSTYNAVKVGQLTFSDYINVSSYDGVRYINLQELEYNSEIRIYIDIDNEIKCYQDSEQDNVKYEYFKAKSENYTNYFKLINKSRKTQISEEGWKRIKKTDSEYKSISTIENKFYGNNPHKGNFKYDDGKEYISHFVELFKYAIENEEFDERKFSGRLDYLNSIEQMKEKGFKDLMDSNNCDYKIYEDSKLHYFCDYIDNNGEEKIYDDGDILNNELKNSYSLRNKKDYSTHSTTSGNVDQIINIKRVDLLFNYTSEDFKCYIEDVVLEYLSQVVPSNVILHVDFKIPYVDFTDYHSDYGNLRPEINESNQCNAKNGVISFLKPLGKFCIITDEGRQDGESNCVIYPNLPLVLTPQSEIKVDFEQYIYPQAVNNIYRTFDEKENKYKYYKWNHSGTDLEEITL